MAESVSGVAEVGGERPDHHEGDAVADRVHVAESQVGNRVDAGDRPAVESEGQDEGQSDDSRERPGTISSVVVSHVIKVAGLVLADVVHGDEEQEEATDGDGAERYLRRGGEEEEGEGELPHHVGARPYQGVLRAELVQWHHRGTWR